jgi:predicted phage terminase large subunit-like protein
VATVAKRAKAELARRELARRHLLDFVQYTFPGYQTNWHHVEFAERLEGWSRGEHLREVIEVPPRHGKSEMLKRACAWTLGRNPDAEVVVGTYSADLASKFARDVKRIMASEQFKRLFDVTVSTGSDGGINQAMEFTLSGAHGGLKAVGVGGGITGRGMTHGVIDDPVKSRQDGESETMRERVWDWYTSDFLTRQQGQGGFAPVVVVHTRWHEDDLIGRLLERDPDLWTVTKYPAINERGEALWPERDSLKKLEAMRATMSVRDWMSLYQQEPVPPGGDIFQSDWFRRYKVIDIDGADHLEYTLPTGEQQTYRLDQGVWYYTQDCAATEKTHGDYTVIATWFRVPGGPLALMRIDRVQYDAPKVLDLMQRRYNEHEELFWIEKNGVGLPIIQMARRKGLPVKELEAHKDKVSRAEGVTPMMAEGWFLLPHSAPWLGKLEKEMLSFPNAAHDDQVDAVVYGCQVWQRSRRRSMIRRQRDEELTARPVFDRSVTPARGVAWTT